MYCPTTGYLSVMRTKRAYGAILCKSGTGKLGEPGGQAQSPGTASLTADSSRNSQFLYITVFFKELKVAGLVDTGSSINVISKNLYDSISESHDM